MIPLFLMALLILAAVGAHAVITATFSVWHLAAVLAVVGGIVLIVRLGWVEIGNLRRGPK